MQLNTIFHSFSLDSRFAQTKHFQSAVQAFCVEFKTQAKRTLMTSLGIFNRPTKDRQFKTETEKNELNGPKNAMTQFSLFSGCLVLLLKGALNFMCKICVLL